MPITTSTLSATLPQTFSVIHEMFAEDANVEMTSLIEERVREMVDSPIWKQVVTKTIAIMKKVTNKVVTLLSFSRQIALYFLDGKRQISDPLTRIGIQALVYVGSPNKVTLCGLAAVLLLEMGFTLTQAIDELAALLLIAIQKSYDLATQLIKSVVGMLKMSDDVEPLANDNDPVVSMGLMAHLLALTRSCDPRKIFPAFERVCRMLSSFSRGIAGGSHLIVFLKNCFSYLHVFAFGDMKMQRVIELLTNKYPEGVPFAGETVTCLQFIEESLALSTSDATDRMKSSGSERMKSADARRVWSNLRLDTDEEELIEEILLPMETAFRAAQRDKIYKPSKIVPFHVCFTGEAGVGKSQVMNDIVSLAPSLLGDESLDFPTDHRMIAYSVPMNSKYMDGYLQQYMVLMDDVCQERTPSESSTLANIIRWVSCTSTNMEGSAIDDKMNEFASKMILSTTNVPYPSTMITGLNCADAFNRRRHLLVECLKTSTKDPILDREIGFRLLDPLDPQGEKSAIMSFDLFLDFFKLRFKEFYVKEKNLMSQTRAKTLRSRLEAVKMPSVVPEESIVPLALQESDVVERIEKRINYFHPPIDEEVIRKECVCSCEVFASIMGVKAFKWCDVARPRVAAFKYLKYKREVIHEGFLPIRFSVNEVNTAIANEIIKAVGVPQKLVAIFGKPSFLDGTHRKGSKTSFRFDEVGLLRPCLYKNLKERCSLPVDDDKMLSLQDMELIHDEWRRVKGREMTESDRHACRNDIPPQYRAGPTAVNRRIRMKAELMKLAIMKRQGPDADGNVLDGAVPLSGTMSGVWRWRMLRFRQKLASYKWMAFAGFAMATAYFVWKYSSKVEPLYVGTGVGRATIQAEPASDGAKKKRLWSVFFKTSRVSGSGFMFRGRSMVTARHTLPYGDGSKIKLLLQGQEFEEDFKLSNLTMVKGKGDVCIYKFTNIQIPPAPDATSHITENVRDGDVEMILPQTGKILCAPAKVSGRKIAYKDSALNEYSTSAALSVEVVANRGDSGSVVLDKGNQKIVGIITSKNTSRTFVANFGKEDILEALGEEEEIVPLALEFEHVVTRPASFPRVTFKGVSSLIPSCLMRVMALFVAYQPAILGPWDNRLKENGDLLARSLKGYDRKYPKLDQSIVKQIVSECNSVDAGRPPGSFGKKILSLTEALNGAGTMKPFELNTSPGLPWIHKKRTGKGKKDFVNGFVPFRTPTHELEGAVTSFDFTKPITGYACLKDELRPNHKIDAGKTRAFIVLPMEYNLILRQFFGAFVDAQHRNVGKEASCVGINPYEDWDQLFDRLSIHSHFWEDFDYSNWDQSLSPDWFEAYAERVSNWYDDGIVNRQIRLDLMKQLAFAHIQVGEECFESTGGNKSGCAITAEINTDIHLMILAYAWIKLAHTYDPPLATMTRMLQHNEFAIYGDDLVKSTDMGTAFWFTGENIKKIVNEMGMEITPADKMKTTFDLKLCYEVQFLKRKFSDQHAPGKMLCPLDQSSIHKMVQYVHKNDDWVEATQLNMETAIKEMFFHGEKEYEIFIQQLKDANYKANLRLKVPHKPWNEIMGEWLEGEMEAPKFW